MIHTDIRDFVEEEVRRASGTALIGKVTRIFQHDDTSETSAINANVITREKDKQHLRNIPVLISEHTGHISVPQKDDYVLVEFLEGASSAPVITEVVHNDDNENPKARAGHWRHEFRRETGDNLYLEAESADQTAGESELVRLAVKQDGLSEPVARIELDVSNGDPKISLTRGSPADMGLELNFGDGTFKLGDGSGHGIVSDGSGNFTWYAQDVNLDDQSTISWE
jgi:hypothetical protein